MKTFYSKRGRKITYLGNEFSTLTPKNPTEKFKSLDDLFAALLESYSAETVHPMIRGKYDGYDDPTFCHCTITSMVVQDYFGGEILATPTPTGGSHYFNRIDGKIIDLTSDQFTNKNIVLDYSNISIINREEIPEKKEGADSRYAILKQKVESKLN